MRKYLILLACLATLAYACSKTDPSGPDPTPTPPSTTPITVASGTNLSPTVTSDGGSNTINFTATQAWTASIINTKADSWISIDKTSGGAGSIALVVTIKANDTPDDRQATVQIKSGTTIINIVYSQKQKDALTVTASRFDLTSKRDTITIEASTNISLSYSFIGDCGSWIKHLSTKALSTKVLTFEISENTSVSKREGAIIISGGNLKDTVKVYQQGETPSLVLSKNEYTLDPQGGEISVDVNSNVNVNVKVADQWVHINQTKTISTNSYVFTVDPNDTQDERSTTLTFYNDDYKLTETVKINQKEKDALIITTSRYDLSAKCDTITIEAATNVNLSHSLVGDCGSWIKPLSTKALSTKVLTFEISENTSVSKREGAIIISGGNLKDTVKVYQQGETPSLVLSKNEYTLDPQGGDITVDVNSNVTVNISFSSSWIHHISTKTASTKSYVFTIDSNYDSIERSTEIIFSNENYGLSETVRVIQKANEPPVVFFDQNFKKYCVDNFDKDKDGEISTKEAEAVTEINYSAENIHLYGLEAFTNLKSLIIRSATSDETNFWSHWLSSYECISHLAKLTHLECTGFSISTLDVSKMVDLEYLDVSNTFMNNLDVSRNTKLSYLDCSPIVYDNLKTLVIFKGQTIPNVTTNRDADYIPSNTIILTDGSSTGSGNEGTYEGGEI